MTAGWDQGMPKRARHSSSQRLLLRFRLLTSHLPSIGSAITGNILWKQIRQAPGHIANRVFPRFVRIFHFTNGWFQKRGVKNPVWATFLTAFLVLWVGSFLINQATRFIGRVLLNMSYSGYRETRSAPQSSDGIVRPALANPAPVTQAALPIAPALSATVIPIVAKPPAPRSSQGVGGKPWPPHPSRLRLWPPSRPKTRIKRVRSLGTPPPKPERSFWGFRGN